MEMLQAQAQHHGGQTFEDVEAVAEDDKLSGDEKKTMLQKALNMAASNGDITQVSKILNGKAKAFVDVDAPDEDGTPPLIYASCFVSRAAHPPISMAHADTSFTGTRKRCAGSCECRRGCGQARSKPLECSDVGYDKSAQRDC